MILLYSILLSALVLLLAPLLPLLLLHPRVRAGLGERLGILPASVREQAWLSEGSLWVHAASLGEVNAVAPVLRELLPKLPRLNLLITCTTVAGREQARRLFPQAGACLLLPLDLPFLIGPWVRRFKPRLAVIAETELWPNFLSQLHQSGACLLVANGRLTARSAKRYAKLGRAFSAVLDNVDLFAMQAEEDAQRLLSLGARKARVQVTGNTKFDLAGDLAPALEGAEPLRKALGLPKDAELIVAGSTRPGEEALLLPVFKALRKQRPALRLILAPRHLERTEELLSLLKAAQLKAVRRSANAALGDAEVLLLDTLGELRTAYALAVGKGLAWVGGGFKDFGGQNPLEPAALGLPVIFGPHMRHFPEVSQALLAAGGAKQVDASGLAAVSAELLASSKLRQGLAEAAQACVKEHAGASRRTADLGLKLLLLARLRRDGQAWREEGQQKLREVNEFGSSLEDPDWRHEAPGEVVQGREFGLGLEKDGDGNLG